MVVNDKYGWTESANTKCKQRGGVRGVTLLRSGRTTLEKGANVVDCKVMMMTTMSQPMMAKEEGKIARNQC